MDDFVKNDSFDSNDVTCGIKLYGCSGSKQRLKIRQLQRFATPQCALALLVLPGFFQGFVLNGMTNTIITTIEKRFGLQSAQSGTMASCYDAASLIGVTFVTCMGSRAHKPVWIGWGIMLVGIGCLVFSLPHFAAPPYRGPTTTFNSSELCSSENTSNRGDVSLQHFRFVFFLGTSLMGLGTAPMQCFGMTYLDENVRQKVSSIYHGIYFSFAYALGPSAGYLIAGLLLKIPTNIDQRYLAFHTGMVAFEGSESDIGAWWIGYLGCGACLLILTAPLLLLPKSLPGTTEVRKNRGKEVYHSQAKVLTTKREKNANKTRFPERLKKYSALYCNAPYILIAVATSLDFGLVAGFAVFTPKYIENIYSLSATQAGIYFGIVAIGGASIGTSLGGVVVTKANLKVPGMMKLLLLSTVIAFLLSASFFFNCNEQVFAGGNAPYTHGLANSTSLVATCNMNCGCSTDSYQPVCGSDNITYFSPCFAGCQFSTNKEYFNCTCVSINGGQDSLAKLGKCADIQCENLVPFLTFFFLMMFFTFLCWTPNVQVVLRIVPFSYRSIALGVQVLLLRLLGGIPFPMIFGKTMDLACLVWSSENGEIASCRKYANNKMTLYLYLIIVVNKVFSLTCYGLAIFVYQRRKSKSNPKHPTVPTTA